MKKPYCPECNVKLDLYSITYEFECPECNRQFKLECEEDMQQIVWR